MAEEIFQCVPCEKIFKNKFNLLRHNESLKHQANIKKEDTTKDLNEVITCNYCSKTFTRTASLTRHLNLCELFIISKLNDKISETSLAHESEISLLRSTYESNLNKLQLENEELKITLDECNKIIIELNIKLAKEQGIRIGIEKPRSPTITTNTLNNTIKTKIKRLESVKTTNIRPLNRELVSDNLHKYVFKEFKRGVKGIIDFILSIVKLEDEDGIELNYATSDLSRKKCYKLEDKDPIRWKTDAGALFINEILDILIPKANEHMRTLNNIVNSEITKSGMGGQQHKLLNELRPTYNGIIRKTDAERKKLFDRVVNEVKYHTYVEEVLYDPSSDLSCNNLLLLEDNPIKPNFLQEDKSEMISEKSQILNTSQLDIDRLNCVTINIVRPLTLEQIKIKTKDIIIQFFDANGEISPLINFFVSIMCNNRMDKYNSLEYNYVIFDNFEMSRDEGSSIICNESLDIIFTSKPKTSKNLDLEDLKSYNDACEEQKRNIRFNKIKNFNVSYYKFYRLKERQQEKVTLAEAPHNYHVAPDTSRSISTSDSKEQEVSFFWEPDPDGSFIHDILDALIDYTEKIWTKREDGNNISCNYSENDEENQTDYSYVDDEQYREKLEDLYMGITDRDSHSREALFVRLVVDLADHFTRKFGSRWDQCLS